MDDLEQEDLEHEKLHKAFRDACIIVDDIQEKLGLARIERGKALGKLRAYEDYYGMKRTWEW